uniref:Glycine-rich protein 1-like n=1 Tax=Petromyzon marinus TaxID=7757 RepID=A0AAJ7UF19_PETMA|nr:glycine-rich protein 1-like [Petromyzon marinus]
MLATNPDADDTKGGGKMAATAAASVGGDVKMDAGTVKMDAGTVSSKPGAAASTATAGGGGGGGDVTAVTSVALKAGGGTAPSGESVRPRLGDGSRGPTGDYVPMRAAPGDGARSYELMSFPGTRSGNAEPTARFGADPDEGARVVRVGEQARRRRSSESFPPHVTVTPPATTPPAADPGGEPQPETLGDAEETAAAAGLLVATET